jgi:hypothetical protein
LHLSEGHVEFGPGGGNVQRRVLAGHVPDLYQLELFAIDLNRLLRQYE